MIFNANETNSGGSGVDYLEQKATGTLTSYSNSNITSIVTGAFQYCNNIQELYLPNLTTMTGNSWFQNCGFERFALPKVTGQAIGSACFQSCRNLKVVDLGVTGLAGTAFYNAEKLDTIILRKTSIVTLNQQNNVFGGTCFKQSGTGGTIYIPKVLYDHLGDGTSNDYKAATNWATVDAWGTVTWAKIEGSQYENYYADGTPIT